jgi:hypothetical protein
MVLMISRKHLPIALMFASVLFAFIGFVSIQPARAATNRYVVNPSRCGQFSGFTPCYNSIQLAINASATGDTIIILENMNYGLGFTDAVNNTAGLTIRGNNANGTISVPALQIALANNLTIQDLTMTDALLVRNVTTRVRSQNVTAKGIYVQPTGDLNAALEFVNNKLPQTQSCGGFYCDISVLGAVGRRIDGSILYQGNTVGAINVFVNANSSTTAVLGAAITLDSNTIQDTADVGVRRGSGQTGVGLGNITGNILFNNNRVNNISRGLNVTIDANTRGVITGNVTFTNNLADKIACITFDADNSFNNAMSGNVNITGNTGEVIEVGFRGDFTGTDINVQNNNLTVKNSPDGVVVTVRANRFASNATLRIGDNTGKFGIVVDTFTGANDATTSIYRNPTYFVTYSTATNTGPLFITNNTASGPYPTIFQNNPDRGRIVLLSDSGAINNATIDGNTADNIYLQAGSNVAGNVIVQRNTLPTGNTFVANGATGAGRLTMNYNRMGANTSHNLNIVRINADVNFNAIMGPLFPSGATVNAVRNWWGCNGGPGACFGPSVPNSSPWMVFNVNAVCTPANNKIVVGYNVAFDTNGVYWPNISIPGAVSVGTNTGSVSAPNPRVLKSNFSWNSTIVNVGANATANVSATLDFQTMPASKGCITRTDTIGVYRAGTWLLNTANDSSAPDITATFGSASWRPVVGDWNGDGVDTIGLYNTSTGVFNLRNSNSTGAAEIGLVLGNPNDTPLAGRWDPTMTISGVGVFRPSNGIIYLKRTLTSGFSDYFMILGNPGDTGVAGDWDGEGYDGPGVFRPSQGRWYLSNNGTASGIIVDDGFADYGPVNDPNARPVVGDWNADGVSGIGMLINGAFALRNTPTGSGAANLNFAFGSATDYPVAGHWTAAAYDAPQTNPNSVLILPGAVGGSNRADDGSAD